MSEEASRTEAPVVIKKYANRRLYNTQTSSYVTLDHLCQMVKQGVDFEVHDARTNDDITRSVLTQIMGVSGRAILHALICISYDLV